MNLSGMISRFNPFASRAAQQTRTEYIYRSAPTPASTVEYGSFGSRKVQNGYRAAAVARESGRPMAQGGSADYHLRYDRQQIVRQSQEFDRDNCLYHGIVNRAVTNIIGDGFKLECSTGNEADDEILEKLWEEFCLAPEIRNMFPWWAIENMACRALFVDGDFGAIKLTEGQLQLIESERIIHLQNADAKNRIEQGVSVDEYGRPLQYWVANYNAFGYIQPADAKPIEVVNFVFIANILRTSGTRGIPPMVSSFPMFHRINDVCDSEAVAWQLISKFAMIVNKKEGPVIGNQLTQTDPSRDSSSVNSELRIQDVEGGTIAYGEKDDLVSSVDRNLPGSNFTASVTMFLRLLGLPIGLPIELILLDWSHTNYSSARAALEQAFRMFSQWQRMLTEKWHSPIYRWKVQQWIDQGLIGNRDGIFNHDWITPSFPWIDQLKETEAWGARLDRGLSTHSEACKSVNKDRTKWLKSRVIEIKEAIESAAELNKKFPEAQVDWRSLAGLMAQDIAQPRVPPAPPNPNATPDMPAMPNDATPPDGTKENTNAAQ